MIDFLLGVGSGLGLAYLIYHFGLSGSGDKKLLTILKTTETNIMSAINDAVAALEAKYHAKEAAAVAAALAGVPAQIEAAKAEQEAADAAVVQSAADAIPDPQAA